MSDLIVAAQIYWSFCSVPSHTPRRRLPTMSSCTWCPWPHYYVAEVVAV